METFSLLKLKYWRGSGTSNPANVRTAANAATTIATSVLRSSTGSSSSVGRGGDGDEGSFFDLELSVVGRRNEKEETVAEDSDSTTSESENEEGDDDENNAGDNLFFKGQQLLPLDIVNAVDDEAASAVIASSDGNGKPPHLSVSLLKSATKLRIFALGLKKPKPSQPFAADRNNSPSAASASPNHGRFFVKFKVEEVPIVSPFARESTSFKKNAKARKAAVEDGGGEEEERSKVNGGASSKETVQKYIKMIKPLYVRVSKRYGEKLRFSGLLTAADEPAVRKRLGKSKSAVAAVASPPAASQRRDDSLRQQEDGIQSAIAHCKMTLNAAKGLQSPLVRSKSDPSDDRSEKANAVL